MNLRLQFKLMWNQVLQCQMSPPYLLKCPSVSHAFRVYMHVAFEGGGGGRANVLIWAPRVPVPLSHPRGPHRLAIPTLSRLFPHIPCCSLCFFATCYLETRADRLQLRCLTSFRYCRREPSSALTQTPLCASALNSRSRGIWKRGRRARRGRRRVAL